MKTFIYGFLTNINALKYYLILGVSYNGIIERQLLS